MDGQLKYSRHLAQSLRYSFNLVKMGFTRASSEITYYMIGLAISAVQLVVIAKLMHHYRRMIYSCHLDWQEVGDAPPSRELTNEKLSERLADKAKNGHSFVEFLEKEWTEFDVSLLRSNAFIKAGESYFEPAGQHLRWRNVGKDPPTTEIKNERLAEDLHKGKTSFTRKEWAAFNISALPSDAFIRVSRIGLRREGEGWIRFCSHSEKTIKGPDSVELSFGETGSGDNGAPASTSAPAPAHTPTATPAPATAPATASSPAPASNCDNGDQVERGEDALRGGDDGALTSTSAPTPTPTIATSDGRKDVVGDVSSGEDDGGSHRSFAYFRPMAASRLPELTVRFADEHSGWQLEVWVRQAVLFVLTAASESLQFTFPGKEGTYLTPVSGVAVSGVAILMLAIFLIRHICRRPYHFVFQNVMEGALFASDIVLLILVGIYMSITKPWVEYAMVSLAFGALGAIVAFAAWDIARTERKVRSRLTREHALKKITYKLDKPVADLLEDGTIRLLECSWLLDENTETLDKILPRVTSVSCIMTVKGMGQDALELDQQGLRHELVKRTSLKGDREISPAALQIKVEKDLEVQADELREALKKLKKQMLDHECSAELGWLDVYLPDDLRSRWNELCLALEDADKWLGRCRTNSSVHPSAQSSPPSAGQCYVLEALPHALAPGPTSSQLTLGDSMARTVRPSEEELQTPRTDGSQEAKPALRVPSPPPSPPQAASREEGTCLSRLRRAIFSRGRRERKTLQSANALSALATAQSALDHALSTLECYQSPRSLTSVLEKAIERLRVDINIASEKGVATDLTATGVQALQKGEQVLADASQYRMVLLQVGESLDANALTTAANQVQQLNDRLKFTSLAPDVESTEGRLKAQLQLANAMPLTTQHLSSSLLQEVTQECPDRLVAELSPLQAALDAATKAGVTASVIHRAAEALRKPLVDEIWQRVRRVAEELDVGTLRPAHEHVQFMNQQVASCAASLVSEEAQRAEDRLYAQLQLGKNVKEGTTESQVRALLQQETIHKNPDSLNSLLAPLQAALDAATKAGVTENVIRRAAEALRKPLVDEIWQRVRRVAEELDVGTLRPAHEHVQFMNQQVASCAAGLVSEEAHRAEDRLYAQLQLAMSLSLCTKGTHHSQTSLTLLKKLHIAIADAKSAGVGSQIKIPERQGSCAASLWQPGATAQLHTSSVISQATEALQAHAERCVDDIMRNTEQEKQEVQGIMRSQIWYMKVNITVLISAIAAVKLTKSTLEEEAQRVKDALSSFLDKKPTLSYLNPKSDPVVGLEVIKHKVQTVKGKHFLPRSQDLFDLAKEAFTDKTEASKRLLRSDQSVLVLTHGWRLTSHPDPDGLELEAVRAWLRQRSDKVKGCSLFYDWVSVRQRRADTGDFEVPEDEDLFNRGLDEMVRLYASMSTCVLRLAPDEMPESELALQGVVWMVFEEAKKRPAGEKSLEKDHDDLKIKNLLIQELCEGICPLAVGPPAKHKYGAIYCIRFKPDEVKQAFEKAKKAWKDKQWVPYLGKYKLEDQQDDPTKTIKKGDAKPSKPEDWPFIIGHTYNKARYEDKKWCIFETGVSSATEAMLRDGDSKVVNTSKRFDKLEDAPMKDWCGKELVGPSQQTFPGQISEKVKKGATVDEVLQATEERMHNAIHSSVDAGKVVNTLVKLKKEVESSKAAAENDVRAMEPYVKLVAGLRDAEDTNPSKREFFSEILYKQQPPPPASSGTTHTCGSPLR